MPYSAVSVSKLYHEILLCGAISSLEILIFPTLLFFLIYFHFYSYFGRNWHMVASTSIVCSRSCLDSDLCIAKSLAVTDIVYLVSWSVSWTPSYVKVSFMVSEPGIQIYLVPDFTPLNPFVSSLVSSSKLKISSYNLASPFPTFDFKSLITNVTSSALHCLRASSASSRKSSISLSMWADVGA